MRHRCSRRAPVRHAFSWIDLLFMLAVILLLLLILLPSLRDARRQARAAKCLSNLRLVNVAAIQYCLDYNDTWPLTHRLENTPPSAFSYAYGGKTSSDYWRTVGDGSGFISILERPLNAYLLSDRLTPDGSARRGLTDGAEVQVLDCPDDRTSYARTALEPTATPLRLACYDDVGTSYHFNLHALTGTNLDPHENNGENWTALCRALFREVIARNSGTYVAFLPDPLNYALPAHKSVMGNHGRPDLHELGFLDGHAEYRKIDTTRWSGETWTALVPGWVPAPGATSLPKIHYTASHKANRAPMPTPPRSESGVEKRR